MDAWTYLWKWGPCLSIEMVDWYILIIWFASYPSTYDLS